MSGWAYGWIMGDGWMVDGWMKDGWQVDNGYWMNGWTENPQMGGWMNNLLVDLNSDVSVKRSPQLKANKIKS